MKNPMKLIYLFLLASFAFLSCEEDDLETTECTEINEMEIVTTFVETEDENIVSYNFTTNNAKFANLDYEWTINEAAIDDEKGPSSLLSLPFTGNGTFEICMKPILEDGNNCNVTPICTTLVIDSFEEDQTPADICDLLGLVTQTPNGRISGEIQGSNGQVLIPLQVINATNKPFSFFFDDSVKNNIRWFLDGTELSNEDRKVIFEGNTELESITSFVFTEAGTHEIKVIVISENCPNGNTFYATISVNDNLLATVTTSKEKPTTDENNDQEQGDDEDAGEDQEEVESQEDIDGDNGTEEVEGEGDDTNMNQPIDNEFPEEIIAEDTPPRQLTCDDIQLRGDVLQITHNSGRISSEGRAFFKATRIDDANYTWTVNGQELSAQERQDLTDGGLIFTPIETGDYHSSNFRLGSGTHEVKVFIVSPTVCPNGKTVTSTVTIP